MKKYFYGLMAFVLPIVRTALVQAIADSINRSAYPDSESIPRKRTYPGRLKRQAMNRQMVGSTNWHRQRMGLKPSFHDVLLVAFDLHGRDARDVHNWLMDNMPEGDAFHGDADEIFLDSWWVANDERFDGSDTDSAVFVTKGKQEEARALLREHGLLS